MADTVSQRTEDILQHFEGFEDIQHLARVLADNGELRVDVRSQGYAFLLSKFVDVSELVDFGPGSDRRGHFDFKGLKEQKRRGVEKTEWLGVGCTSTSDLIDGFSLWPSGRTRGNSRPRSCKLAIAHDPRQVGCPYGRDSTLRPLKSSLLK